jgi:hypothetical protein
MKIDPIIAIGLLLSLLLTLITAHELTDMASADPQDVAAPCATPEDSATVHNHGAKKPSLDAEAKGYRRKVPENEDADPSACSVPSVPMRRRPSGGHIATPPPADARRFLQHADRQRTSSLTRRQMGRLCCEHE